MYPFSLKMHQYASRDNREGEEEYLGMNAVEWREKTV